jgi:hypothetical protein
VHVPWPEERVQKVWNILPPGASAPRRAITSRALRALFEANTRSPRLTFHTRPASPGARPRAAARRRSRPRAATRGNKHGTRHRDRARRPGPGCRRLAARDVPGRPGAARGGLGRRGRAGGGGRGPRPRLRPGRPRRREQRPGAGRGAAAGAAAGPPSRPRTGRGPGLRTAARPARGGLPPGPGRPDWTDRPGPVEPVAELSSPRSLGWPAVGSSCPRRARANGSRWVRSSGPRALRTMSATCCLPARRQMCLIDSTPDGEPRCTTGSGTSAGHRARCRASLVGDRPG